MSSERERGWLLDIIEDCERTAEFLGSMSEEEFEATLMAVYAVERCLLRIAEATKRIGEQRFGALIDGTAYHLIVGLGNKLRHEYEMIQLSAIYATARKDLPRLLSECRQALDKL